MKPDKSEASIFCGQKRGSTEESVNDTDRPMCNSAPWTETQIHRLNKEPTDAEVEEFITRLFGILDSDWSAAPFIYFRIMTVVTV